MGGKLYRQKMEYENCPSPIRHLEKLRVKNKFIILNIYYEIIFIAIYFDYQYRS